MTTILVVDDNELVNKLLTETLITRGYEVRQAHDANSAYQFIRQQLPDLILLDIVLPDVNGVLFCQALRNHPETQHIPIILLTGTASSTPEKVHGLKSGADDYVTKPFEMEELMERINALLRRVERRPRAMAEPVKSVPANPPLIKELPKPKVMKVLSPMETLLRVLFNPSQVQELPPASLAFLVSLITLIMVGTLLVSGPTTKPVVACLLAFLLWGFSVSVLVVIASLLGIPLRWKEGASLYSWAAVPFLIKLGGACLFSAWTTLSPFLFTASPLLYFPAQPLWARLDGFELWAAVLLGILLAKRPGATPIKAVFASLIVWLLTALVLAGLSHLGGRLS